MADRKMEVRIFAKDSTKQGTESAERNIDKVTKSAKRLSLAYGAAAIALGTAITAKSISLWAAQEKAVIQIEKRLKSTGAAAWISAQQIQAMSASLQKMSVYGDEAIMQMQSLLLTFKDIRGPIFERTTVAILDMASALAQSTGGEPDLRSAATMVGKALQDPVLGLTAMSRAGIQFSDDQKGVIKSLVETGDKAKAQVIILKELESQFGGASGAEGLAGAIKQLQNAFPDLLEDFGKGVTGASSLETGLRSLTDFISDPQTHKAIEDFGGAIGSIAKWTGISLGSIRHLAAELGSMVGGGGNRSEIDALLARLTEGGPGRDAVFAGLPGGAQKGVSIGDMSVPSVNLGPIMPTQLKAPGSIGKVTEPGAGLAESMAQYKIALSESVNAFKFSLMTEEQQLDVTYENRLDKLDEFNNMGLLSEASYLSIKKQLHEENELAITAITKREARNKERIARGHTDIVLGFANNLASAISAGSDKTNRKSFERDKKMNIGLAVVNTAVGATRAFKDYSYPWNIIAAAAVVAAGAAQISTIKSQSYGGSGDGVSSAPIGAITPGQSGPVSQPQTGQDNKQDLGPTYNIRVEGNIVDQDAFARTLITSIDKAKNDGVTA